MGMDVCVSVQERDREKEWISERLNNKKNRTRQKGE